METFEQFKEKQFKQKPKLKEIYDLLEPQYELASQVIGARVNKELSQKQLAHKMGTVQSAVARLESGNYNPSIKLLNKVAKATDTRLVVKFEDSKPTSL